MGLPQAVPEAIDTLQPFRTSEWKRPIVRA
jgi:hypothetical protein